MNLFTENWYNFIFKFLNYHNTSNSTVSLDCLTHSKKTKKHGLYITTASRIYIYICIQHSYPHYWLFDAVTNILTWVAHWLYITTAQQDTCIYMHTTLWDITTYLGQGHSSLLIIWCSDQYTYMSCVHLCVCHDNILSVMIACKQI